jgi:hypothetical protein
MNYGGRTRRGTMSRQTGNTARPLLSFALVCAAMFMNLLLAFAFAQGVPVSSGTVIATQAALTALALPAILTLRARFGGPAIIALAFLLFSTIVTNILNPINPKSIYDTLLIPIFIGLGMSASYVRDRWMNILLIFVLAVVLIEMLAPSIYSALFNPAGYLAATREWIGDKAANASSEDGLYTGAYRAGGSFFAFTDHRVGGPFLEPLSLGYFAFVMSLYYAGLHRGSIVFKFIAIIICLIFALASDSRATVLLIVISTVFLIIRLRLPVILLWLTFPAVLGLVYLLYLTQFTFLYGDMFNRLSVTFDALKTVDLGQLIAGMVPLERAGDSGILYMLRCVGLLGMPVAIWFYSGAFTYARGSNVSFFVMVTVYLTITLMLGGATLSIKTASLLGYLVGLASISGRSASKSSRSDATPHLDQPLGYQHA